MKFLAALVTGMFAASAFAQAPVAPAAAPAPAAKVEAKKKGHHWQPFLV